MLVFAVFQSISRNSKITFFIYILILFVTQSVSRESLQLYCYYSPCFYIFFHLSLASIWLTTHFIKRRGNQNFSFSSGLFLLLFVKQHERYDHMRQSASRARKAFAFFLFFYNNQCGLERTKPSKPQWQCLISF